ncbi:MAG TPA: hypothetical protein VK582_10960 [Pyrinomonadaceae bacterium]|nr:hypothetical protein [Pyrinomonadaceae bacterium]
MLPDEQAKIFLQYDYAEGKALCTQFLTIVVAVLVFSLAFSEKIADFHKASKLVKGLLLTAWCLFMIAIILGGVALYDIAMAAGNALYGHDTSYYEGESAAMTMAIIGGGSFIAGLIALMLSAVGTVFRRHRNSVN